MRLDTADKINGKQVYAIDVTLPGMLNASIMDAPVFGAKVKSYDEAKAQAMPGVRHVVKVGDTAVAVVADSWWQANQALKALNIAWEQGANDKVSSDAIHVQLQDGLDAKDGAFVGNRSGDAAQAIAGAAKKLEAVYFAPFENHFTMEGCTAPKFNTATLHSAVVELVAMPGAKLQYITVQNWSANVFNLVTKRGLAHEEAEVKWIDCNIGSRLTMKYPGVIMKGRKARGEVLAIARLDELDDLRILTRLLTRSDAGKVA